MSAALGALLLAHNASAAPAGAQITDLPGSQGLDLPLMFSGYLPVSPTKHLFYLHAQSQGDPATDPLLFWFTGGPGCSGLFGMITEMGPFSVSATNFSQLEPNPYAWTTNANVVWLEQPCGVGFSYSSASQPASDYTSGDTLAAADAYAFVKAFYAAYPEFGGRKMALTGESYAGKYVPMLAELLFDTPFPGLNFFGFMIGNPSFDPNPAAAARWWQFLANSGEASMETYQAAVVACNYTFASPQSPECSNLTSAMLSQISGINPYNVKATCEGPVMPGGYCFTTEVLGERAPQQLGGQTVVPCMNISSSVAYFQNPLVQRALHVLPGTAPAPWDACSSVLNYTQYGNTFAIFGKLKDHLHMLVYSGDLDSCVPGLVTQAAVESLGFERRGDDWSKWVVKDENGNPQVAGWQRVWSSPTVTPGEPLFAYLTVSALRCRSAAAVAVIVVVVVVAVGVLGRRRPRRRRRRRRRRRALPRLLPCSSSRCLPGPPP